MILLIDNYDSFTYNLYQALQSCQPSAVSRQPAKVWVLRNDEVTCEILSEWFLSHIVLSPGPKRPEDSGICLDLIRKTAGKIPLLGVCLGHQAVAHAFGGRVVPAKEIRHGKTSPIFHDGNGLFAGLPSPLTATRYHSLAVEAESLPTCLEITARAADGEIMALQHKQWPVYGVQFHPESVLTPAGPALLKNFLRTVH